MPVWQFWIPHRSPLCLQRTSGGIRTLPRVREPQRQIHVHQRLPFRQHCHVHRSDRGGDRSSAEPRAVRPLFHQPGLRAGRVHGDPGHHELPPHPLHSQGTWGGHQQGHL